MRSGGSSSVVTGVSSTGHTPAVVTTSASQPTAGAAGEEGMETDVTEEVYKEVNPKRPRVTHVPWSRSPIGGHNRSSSLNPKGGSQKMS